MGKIVIGLIVGAVIGAAGALVVGGGAMMGAGAGTGLSLGVCSTVEAAEQLGFLSEEQVDQVLTRAANNISGGQGLPEDAAVAGSAAACREIMQKMTGQNP